MQSSGADVAPAPYVTAESDRPEAETWRRTVDDRTEALFAAVLAG